MNELVKVKNEIVMTSNQIADQTGKEHFIVMRDIRKLIESIQKEDNTKVHSQDIIESTYINKQNKTQPNYILTKKGVKLLLSTYRGITQDQIKTCGIDDLNVIHTYTRFETSFIDMLDKALREFSIKGIRQFNSCGKYRIDYYIPSLKLAIEYDEEQHKSQIDYDIKREMDIIEELDCRFIRCDYKLENIINVMKVLKEII